MKPDELAFAGSCKRRKVKLEVDASGCDFAFIYAPGCEVVSRLWSSLQCLAVRVFTKQPAVFLFKATTKTRDPKPRRCSNLAKMDPPTGWKSIKGPLFVSCVGHCYFVWCLSVKTIWRFRLQLWALLLVKVKRTNVKKKKRHCVRFQWHLIGSAWRAEKRVCTGAFGGNHNCPLVSFGFSLCAQT